jgi:hypothetical protein
MTPDVSINFYIGPGGAVSGPLGEGAQERASDFPLPAERLAALSGASTAALAGEPPFEPDVLAAIAASAGPGVGTSSQSLASRELDDSGLPVSAAAAVADDGPLDPEVLEAAAAQSTRLAPVEPEAWGAAPWQATAGPLNPAELASIGAGMAEEPESPLNPEELRARAGASDESSENPAGSPGED